MFQVLRRVVRLEERARRTGMPGRCAVCGDGERSSGLVFRISGIGPTDEALPVCAGCGRCNALVFNIVPATQPPAAA